jgi:putative transposase
MLVPVKRLPRKTRIAWNEAGHAHFLTYSCFQRLPLLTRDRTRKWVIAAMEDLRQSLLVALWAYVIMPEHVHVLLYPE